MLKEGKYPGIHNDLYGGMTDVGRIIRDAWALGVLPETETCEGWEVGRIRMLDEQVYQAWEPYQHMPFLLPPEMKEHYIRIQEEARRHALELGWEPPMETADDS